MGNSLIMGSTQATSSQMVSYYLSTGHVYPSDIYSSKGASTIQQFCTLVCEEASAEGVRAEVLFVQAMQETGWLQFGGQVNASQCNFGGLGATGGGVSGAVFPSVRIGLRAQVQHLKCYASTEALVNPLVDQRRDAVVSTYGRGSAPRLQDLNGKWAVPGNSYGQELLKKIERLLTY